jgi:glycosyltransferase involved in cell wall biosynthesis
MANYNHGHFIETALTALTSQSLPPDEIVVVDDGSTDDSLEKISRLAAEHSSIRLITNERNQGAVAAYQRAFGEARGKYVYGAAADDWVLPGFFERTVAMLEGNQTAGLCVTLRQETDTDGTVVLRDRPSRPSEVQTYLSPVEVRRILLEGGFFIAGTNTVYRRSALSPYLPWDPELAGFIDGFVAHTIALESGVCFIPESLVSRRGGEGRYSLQGSDDPVHVFTRTNRAAFLMSETYGYIWPRGFSEQYRSMAARDLTRTLLARHQGELAEYRGRMRLLNNYSPGRLNGLSLALLTLPDKLAPRIARVLLLLSYRPSIRRVWIKLTRNRAT